MREDFNSRDIAKNSETKKTHRHKFTIYNPTTMENREIENHTSQIYLLRNPYNNKIIYCPIKPSTILHTLHTSSINSIDKSPTESVIQLLDNISPIINPYNKKISIVPEVHHHHLLLWMYLIFKLVIMILSQTHPIKNPSGNFL